MKMSNPPLPPLAKGGEGDLESYFLSQREKGAGLNIQQKGQTQRGVHKFIKCQSVGETFRVLLNVIKGKRGRLF
jgi:hypothetical protein